MDYFQPDYNYPGSDFDQQQADLERKRALAASLYKNLSASAGQNANSSGQYNGIAAFLGNLLAGYGGTQTEKDLMAQQQGIDTKKTAANQAFAAGFPQVIPGKPGGDLAGDGMGPPTPPILPQTPSNQDWAKYAATAPQTPYGQAAVSDILKNIAPELPSKRTDVTPYGIYRNDTETWGEQSPEQAARIKAEQDIKIVAEQDRHQTALMNSQTAQQRAEEDARHNREMEQLRGLVANNAMTGKYVPADSTTPDGRTLVRNTATGTVHPYDANGIPDPKPYAGPILNKGDQKNVDSAMGVMADIKMAHTLAEQVKQNPEVFGLRANVGNMTSGVVGGIGREGLTGLTPEQLQLRGMVMRDFAETTKRLYGASFTASEQARANTFVPQQGDSAAVIATKLEGAARFNEEMNSKYGQKVNAAAESRMSAPVAPVAPIQPQGGILPSTRFPAGTDLPGMGSTYEQYAAQGKITPAAPMLPQPMAGAVPGKAYSTQEARSLPRGTVFLGTDGQMHTVP